MKIYSTKETARALGISVRRVQKLCQEGRLKAKRLNGGDWVVLSLEYVKKHNYPVKGGDANKP